jgi:DNA-binding transcriptional MerR regulator
MSGIRTRAAAAMLAVSPNTLRSWERRYGYPQPMRSAGGHRQYALTEIEALRAALSDTHDVSSAVALVQQRGAGPSSGRRLADALRDFDEDAANCLLDESLALRSIERTIEDVLLEAVAAIADRDPLTPEYEFAWRYATGWMAALKRLSPPARLPQGVLVLDASSLLELDALHAQALELVLRRAGLRTLSLSPALDPSRLGRALRALRPWAVILTGRSTSLDAVARVIYAARGVRNDALVFDFGGAIPDTGATTVTRLGSDAVVARDRLLERLDGHPLSMRSPHALACR